LFCFFVFWFFFFEDFSNAGWVDVVSIDGEGLSLQQ
jgi:hypothetical protein